MNYDKVYSPKHYDHGGIECIDAMIAAFGEEKVEAFCEINAFKYLWRCHYKDSKEQDLMKARWYIDYALKVSSDMRLRKSQDEAIKKV